MKPRRQHKRVIATINPDGGVAMQLPDPLDSLQMRVKDDLARTARLQSSSSAGIVTLFRVPLEFQWYRTDQTPVIPAQVEIAL